MPSLIERLLVGEVSLVDEAANRRSLLLLKNLGDKPVDKLVKLALETTLEDEGSITKKLDGVSEDSQNAVLAALRILRGHGEELDSEVMKSLATDFGIPEPKVVPPPPEDKKKETEEPEDAIKSLPEDLQEVFTKQRETNDVLQKRLDKAETRADVLERASKLDDYVVKAKELGLPGANSEEMGEALLTIDENAPEAYKRMISVLESTANVLKDSKLFKSVGSSAPGGGENTAWEKITKRARQREAESNGKINFQNAVDQIMREDRSLAEQYQEETR